MRFVAVSVILFAGCTAGIVLYGASRWTHRTKALQARLLSAQAPLGPAVVQRDELAALPLPVRQFFRAVLGEEQRIIRAARFMHSGTFNMGETRADWRPCSSTQVVTTRRPGFVWDGRIEMVPGLNAYVHDAYLEGEGALDARFLGLIPLANVRGTPEMAEGELLRYLAEAMWYPTALLPGEGVTWTAIDATSARATLTDGNTTVSMDFLFAPDGSIESSYAAARPRTVGGQIVRTAWRGRAWGYEVRSGMRIPIEAEVAWILPDGAYPYWRGRITNIEYEHDKIGQAIFRRSGGRR